MADRSVSPAGVTESDVIPTVPYGFRSWRSCSRTMEVGQNVPMDRQIEEATLWTQTAEALAVRVAVDCRDRPADPDSAGMAAVENRLE